VVAPTAADADLLAKKSLKSSKSPETTNTKSTADSSEKGAETGTSELSSGSTPSSVMAKSAPHVWPAHGTMAQMATAAASEWECHTSDTGRPYYYNPRTH
jgi:hypothetical protein